MSHVPFEYWIPASVLMGIATAALLWPAFPNLADNIAVYAAIFWAVVYAYSPLPQGPTASNHMKRKRKWGFKVEHERDQKKLDDFRE